LSILSRVADALIASNAQKVRLQLSLPGSNRNTLALNDTISSSAGGRSVVQDLNQHCDSARGEGLEYRALIAVSVPLSLLGMSADALRAALRAAYNSKRWATSKKGAKVSALTAISPDHVQNQCNVAKSKAYFERMNQLRLDQVH